MKIFDASELRRGMIFHIQDHDRGFIFVGRLIFYGSDFIQFDVLPFKEQPSCKTWGMYTFGIGSKFTLHGMKWNDERKEYVYDESIISNKDLEKDDEEEDVKKTKEVCNMKFDTNKAADLLYDTKFHIRDHDNHFQFYGIFKSIKPDELVFHITGQSVGAKIHGEYIFPAGSHFNLYKMRLDATNTEWVFTQNNIDWKDLMEMDNNEKKEMKEEKEMNVEVWKVKPGSWKDCVVKDVSLIVNDQIKDGDTIYRITTDYVDIKGKMTINNVIGPRISLEFDGKCGIPNTTKIYLMPEMRVFKTDSETDPGFLLQEHKDTFNPELRVGKLYWIANADLEFQYVMHVRAINENSIDVNLITTVTELNNTSSIKITGKSFDITELLEYKFKEV